MMDYVNLARQLLVWYDRRRRELPWRTENDPYRIWVSEVMLQQTRVEAVIPYYHNFLRRFPDMRSLAEAPPEELLSAWQGLGYYSRARNLQQGVREALFSALLITRRNRPSMEMFFAYSAVCCISKNWWNERRCDGGLRRRCGK